MCSVDLIICHTCSKKSPTLPFPHAWRRNFAKRLGNSYLSSHLLGNDQKVCEENYSNAIDFAEALTELEKKGLKKGLKIGLKMDQTLKKEA